MKAHNGKHSGAHRLVCAIAIIGSAAFSSGALACEASSSALRETPTGSHIARAPNPNAQPMIELDRKYIEQSGATTSAELLRTVPAMQNFPGRVTAIGGASSRSSR